MEASLSVEKGKIYTVLAVFISTKNIRYYIQSSVNNNYTPHWADAGEFEVVDSSVYSDWVIDVSFHGDSKSVYFTPKIWKDNESWFVDELIDETPRAAELFLRERDKIVEEMKK